MLRSPRIEDAAGLCHTLGVARHRRRQLRGRAGGS